MIKEQTEERQVVQDVPVGRICTCDVCGKEIYKVRYNYPDKIKNGLPDEIVWEFSNEYWELTTGHNDWGNDSCESYAHYYLCSEPCVKTKYLEYFNMSCEKTGDGRNSMFFELTHRHK